MIRYIALYILFFGILFYLLERFHRPILKLTLLLGKFLKMRAFSLVQRVRGESGEELRDSLTSMLYSDSGLIPSGEISVPRYKFFTTLIREILRLNGIYGGEMSNCLSSLKRGLDRELKFDRKLSSELKGGVTQLLSISATTWAFIALSIKIVEISPPVIVLSLIGVWQCIGVALYLYLSFVQKKKILGPVEQLFYPLYYLKNLLTAGMSIQELLGGVSLSYCNVRGRDLVLVEKRLTKVIVRISNYGILPDQEIDDLIDELWFVREERFEKLKKRSIALRFLIMGIFFVSSYFLYLFFMVQGLV